MTDLKTEPQSEQEFLESYNIHDFDVPLTSVDMAIFTVKDHELKVLLVKRAQYPAKGQWALPGGFINLGEDKDLDTTAARKLREKTGVDTSHLEQVVTVGSQTRDPRGWSVTVVYMALIPSEHINLVADTSSEEVNWISVKTIESTLAFDHKDILEQCYERLRSKVQYTSLPVNLLPEEFTLTDLQGIFEVVLGGDIEKKSFRKRVLDADILLETGNMRTGSNRPAKLYSVTQQGKSHIFPRSIVPSK